MFVHCRILQRLLIPAMTAVLVFPPGGTAFAAQQPPNAKKVGGGLNFFSVREEVEMGRRYSEEMNGKLQLIADPEVTRFVEQMGARLVENSLRRDLDYHFFVVNTKEVNAFALPGGFVYVNRGLIEAGGNESELAGVLGHEIGHVVGRHSLKQMSKQLLLLGIVAGTGAAISQKSEKWGEAVALLGGVGVFFAQLKYSRDDERQADSLGLYEMSQAGYDAWGMVTFFQTLDRLSKEKGGGGPSFLSTHPLPAERVSNMRREIQGLKLPAAGDIKSDSSMERCRARLAAIPLPPPSKDKTLRNALASLDPPAAKSSPASPGRVAQGATEEVKTLEIPGDTVWLDTGVDLLAGETAEISASGRVYYKKNSDQWCDPDGVPDSSGGFFKPLPKERTGALIARFGSASTQYFVVGRQRVLRSPSGGRLHLGINDDNNFDNRGSYRAKIVIIR